MQHQVIHRTNQATLANTSDYISVGGASPASPHSLPTGLQKRSSSMDTAKSALMAIKHSLAALASFLVCSWSLHYRGGVAWYTEKKPLIFNWHPILMVLGLVVLYGEGIVVYRFYSGAKAVKKVVHFTLLGLGFLLSVIGIWAAYRFHIEMQPPIDNFYSLHSWFGLITLGGFILQWVVGFITFWYPGGSGPQRGQVLPWHVVAGLVLYALAIMTAELGIIEKLTFLQNGKTISRWGGEAMLANALGLVLALLGSVVVLLVTKLEKPREEGYRSLTT